MTFGVYFPTQWQQGPDNYFEAEQVWLFQLAPIHDVFGASTINPQHAYFADGGDGKGRIGVGVSAPSSIDMHATQQSAGSASLILDHHLQSGVFTHKAEEGGSYSEGTSSTGRARGGGQERFRVVALEVWGFGSGIEKQCAFLQLLTVGNKLEEWVALC